MEIKYTIQGLLIYISIAAYLLALLVSLLRRPRAAHTLYVLGFVVALVSFGYRWHHVRHVPMQNLFEVFLCLGMIYPVSVFCRRVLHIGGRSADMLIGAVVLVPAGFFFNADPQMLPPALQSWLFAPHVAVYMISYVFMTKAASHALWQLVGRDPKSDQNLLPPEEATYRLICIGFPLLTLGLVLGSVWGKLAWGDYWGWDPKELWSLASWLVYVGYLHYRYMSAKRHPSVNSLWAIAGVVVIVVTLLWVNLSRLFAGLHTYAAG
ncbi:MAG TPA: cytochrome c biogenesis protein CcsA [Sedimentisphaerales bacterium]|nr:cytochrome c biogenesis protein CcsA [Sedimentisphaerales bacterium]